MVDEHADSERCGGIYGKTWHRTHHTAKEQLVSEGNAELLYHRELTTSNKSKDKIVLSLTLYVITFMVFSFLESCVFSM